MKVYRLDLLTLLISLFSLGACNNPDQIGLDVDPTNGINTAINDNSTVLAFTVPEEKIFTNNLAKYPIGYFVDPDLGITQASVGASINLPSDSLKFGTNAVLDSAVLVLKYSDSFYGDSLTSDYRFSVQQLSAKLNPLTSYYNDTPIAYNNTEVGAKVISKIKLRDSIPVTQIRIGKADTVIKQAPQIRIPISASFINSQFINAAAANFYTPATFLTYFKGLYIKVDPMGVGKAGGIPFFDFTSGASKLELYYRNVNAKIDTNYVTFAINNSIAPVVANFSHDYTGTEVATQLSNPTVEYNRVFTQALAGLRTKITFPNLDQLKQLGNIYINKAELILSVEGGTDDPFAPAPRMMLYQTDIASQRKLVPDLDPYDARFLSVGGFGGLYDSTNKTYTFNLTAYIQDLLIGKAKQYALYVAPTETTLSNLANAIKPSAGVASKVVLGSGKSSANFKMKLRVKYSLINN
ncbi:MAG: DUF4270 domain-containing protein [Sphingobacteriaceae bacterium]